MSHEISRINGVDAFVAVGARSDVWHSLGTYVDGAMTAAEAMRLAQLDFTAVKSQNYSRNPQGKVMPTDSYSVYRSDNNALLGSKVGAGYCPVQPVDAFAFCDALVEAPGGAHYDTAGCLGGSGEKIFLSIRVPSADIEVVPGDVLQSSLIFSTTFDGSGSSNAFLSTTRPVCSNTLRAALSSANGLLKVKHTSGQAARFEQALRLMSGVKQDAMKLREKLQLLASRKMTRETMVAVMDRLFPTDTDKSTAAQTRRENTVAEIMSLYEIADGGAFPQVKGTAYQLVNAFTEYADFVKGVKITSAREGYSVARARAENAAIGSGDALKQDALAAILELTAPLAMSAAAGR